MKAAFALISLLTLAFHALGQNAQANLTAKAGLDQQLNAQLPLNRSFRDEHGAATLLADYFGAKPVILVLAYYECPNMCTPGPERAFTERTGFKVRGWERISNHRSQHRST